MRFPMVSDVPGHVGVGRSTGRYVEWHWSSGDMSLHATNSHYQQEKEKKKQTNNTLKRSPSFCSDAEYFPLLGHQHCWSCPKGNSEPTRSKEIAEELPQVHVSCHSHLSRHHNHRSLCSSESVRVIYVRTDERREMHCRGWMEARDVFSVLKQSPVASSCCSIIFFHSKFC